MPHWTYPNTPRGNKALVFGHSLLHAYWRWGKRGHFPPNWPATKIIKYHAHHVEMMRARGFKHNTPLR